MRRQNTGFPVEQIFAITATIVFWLVPVSRPFNLNRDTSSKIRASSLCEDLGANHVQRECRENR
jgi:hypothetical protein